MQRWEVLELASQCRSGGVIPYRMPIGDNSRAEYLVHRYVNIRLLPKKEGKLQNILGKIIRHLNPVRVLQGGCSQNTR